MYKVILDSNFLLVPFQFKVDVFSEIERLVGRFEPIVLSTTLEEIKKLSEEKTGKVRRQASSALELIRKRCNIVEVNAKSSESYDDVIVRVAKESGSIVATNDGDLRKKLRAAGITTVFLRQRSHLQIDGYL